MYILQYEDISALALSATEMVKEIDNVSNAVQANMATTEQTAAASVELSVKRFLHMLFIKFAEIKL